MLVSARRIHCTNSLNQLFQESDVHLYAINNHNVTTIQCLFYKSNKSVIDTFDYKWFVFTEIPFATAEACNVTHFMFHNNYYNELAR